MKKTFDTNSRNYLTDYKIIGNNVYLYLGTGEVIHTMYSEDIAEKIKKKVESQIKKYNTAKEELDNKIFGAEVKKMFTVPGATLLYLLINFFLTSNIVVLITVGIVLCISSFKLYEIFDKEIITAKDDLGKFITSPEAASLVVLKEKVKNISNQKPVVCKKKVQKQKPILMTLEQLKELKSQVMEDTGDKEKIEETGASIKFKPKERL